LVSAQKFPHGFTGKPWEPKKYFGIVIIDKKTVPNEWLYCTGKKRGDKPLPAIVLAREKNRVKEDGGVVIFSVSIRPANPLCFGKRTTKRGDKNRVRSLSFFIDKDCGTGYGPLTESLFRFCL
jgi:hypothetical protein